MTCNTHIRTRVAFHVLTNTISLTHTCADTLSLFQWFVGWHFLGLLSLHELFTHPPSFAVSNTDLMGRKKDRQTERERESNQADTWSDAAKQRVVVRQRDRLRGSGARTWIFILPRTSRLHSNIKPGSIELQWKKGQGQVKKASVL